MTTGPETIAAAIRDGLHELAEAIASRETPRMGPRSDEQAEVASVDPEGNHTPERPVEAATRVLLDWSLVHSGFDNAGQLWAAAAQALADAGLLATPRPMTVGQLTAEHIGKRVRIESFGDLRLDTAEMVLNGFNPDLTRVGCRRSADTPCEVLDD